MSVKTNMLDCTSVTGKKISIPLHKITGITETADNIMDKGLNTFIATGADEADGGENGWYVSDEFETVRRKIDLALDV